MYFFFAFFFLRFATNTILPVLVNIGKLKLNFQFSVPIACEARATRAGALRARPRAPRALRTQLAPKIENCELKQVGRVFYFLGCFFQKSVETAVPDDGNPPGALILTKLVE